MADPDCTVFAAETEEDRRKRSVCSAPCPEAVGEPERAHARYGHADQVVQKRADDQRPGLLVDDADASAQRIEADGIRKQHGSQGDPRRGPCSHPGTGKTWWIEDPSAQVAHAVEGLLAAE